VPIKQISVFLENQKGRLAEITRVLSKHDIDISAISIADTENFGILRMIVNKTEEAVRVISQSGYTVDTTEVLAIEVKDSPGGLNTVLEILDKEDISIEYVYSFVKRPSESALILFKVEEPTQVTQIMQKSGINVLSHEEVYNL
jgi:hypothetical protein